MDIRLYATNKGKILCYMFDLDDKAWKFFLQQLVEFWKQYVHGDLRDLNIIYGKLPGEIERKYYIIDIHWEGESNELSSYQYENRVVSKCFSFSKK